MKNIQFEKQIKELAATFERDGYAVVQNFLSNEEVDELRNEALRLIRNESLKDMQIFGNDFNIKSQFFLAFCSLCSTLYCCLSTSSS